MLLRHCKVIHKIQTIFERIFKEHELELEAPMHNDALTINHLIYMSNMANSTQCGNFRRTQGFSNTSKGNKIEPTTAPAKNTKYLEDSSLLGHSNYSACEQEFPLLPSQFTRFPNRRNTHNSVSTQQLRSTAG